MLPSSAKRMSFARRVPHGVVGVISPFNFPLILSTRAVAPALALGNAVLLKPDPQTPVTGGFILARLFEAAGLPPGLLQVLPGGAAAGEAMITDPDVRMISFTGSTATGRRVGELASRHLKKVTLELGGKNSTIVLDDADLDVAALERRMERVPPPGADLHGDGTVLAHRKVARDLTERLVEKAKKLPVGDPNAGQCALGPLINERQLERVEGIVKDAVAKGASPARPAGSTSSSSISPRCWKRRSPACAFSRRRYSGRDRDRAVRQRRGSDRARERHRLRAFDRRDHPVARSARCISPES